MNSSSNFKIKDVVVGVSELKK